MTTKEIKSILVRKFKDEGCCFKANDISVAIFDNGNISIVIDGYEHIPFTIEREIDGYFGYCVWVTVDNFGEREIIHLASSKKEYKMEEALVYLGYYIATRF